MKIIISPAKKMNIDTDTFSYRNLPVFLEQAKEILSHMKELSYEEAKKVKMGGGTTLYYFKEMGEHPASDYLAHMEKPILIMQGSKDFQAKVDPDYIGYQSLLKGRDNVIFKLYEGLNHAFVPAIYEVRICWLQVRGWYVGL